MIRHKVAEVLANVAICIGTGPAVIITKVFPDGGPGSTAYAAIVGALSLAITSPITLPMFIAVGLLEVKSKPIQLWNVLKK